MYVKINITFKSLSYQHCCNYFYSIFKFEILEILLIILIFGISIDNPFSNIVTYYLDLYIHN